jgi:hypothetical protein
MHRATATQAAGRVRFERLVTGQDLSRADKPLFLLPEPALADVIGSCFDFFRSLKNRPQRRFSCQSLS